MLSRHVILRLQHPVAVKCDIKFVLLTYIIVVDVAVAPGGNIPGQGQQPGAEQSGAEPADGERGIFSALTGRKSSGNPQGNQGGWGKVAMGTGAGVLLGGVLEHEWKNHGHFSMSGPKMDFNPLGKISGFLGGMKPQQQQQQQHHQQQQQNHHFSGMAALGLGGLGAAGAAALASGSSHPPAASGSFGPPVASGAFGPPMNIPQSMSSGHGTLNILSANYGGGDVTRKVRALVKPGGHLDLSDEGNTSFYDRQFGDHWVCVWKSLLILYQYSGRAPELLITWQGANARGLSPADPPRQNRKMFFTECGPVIAVVWGIMEGRNNPCSSRVIQEIAQGMNFKATTEYFEFDGWKGQEKTAVVFYRLGGQVMNMALRDGGMGKLDV